MESVDTVVVGAGIAGLTCAYRLKRAGRSVAVFERDARVGGAIATRNEGGYLLELGPNTIQRSNTSVEALIDDLDLAQDVIQASSVGARRYIVRNGRPVAVPSSPFEALTTNLLSWRARVGILAEPFRRSRPQDADESVADFVRRRLGSEFLAYTIDPFVSGVYAGDPERLSMQHAFPKMVRMEEESGSLILGAVRTMRRRPPAPRWKMFSFSNGLATLPETLHRALGGAVHPGTPVIRIRKTGRTWLVTHSAGEVKASSVVLSVPLHSLPNIDFEGMAEPRLSITAHYPPLAVVHTAYRRSDVQHPLDGFGMLVPSVERDIRILGSLFTSSLFDGRTPENMVVLTSFLGGRLDPNVIWMGDDEIFEQVETDLARLLGIQGGPRFRHLHAWRHAIPQYELGYGALKRELEALEARHSGLFFAGNYRDGISVAQTIESADGVTRRVMENPQLR